MITEPLNRVLERRRSLMLLAYIGYQVRGRGAVVAVTDVLSNVREAFYLTASDKDTDALGLLDDETLGDIRTYDPEHEIICIEVPPDDDLIIYQVAFVRDTLDQLYRRFKNEQLAASA